MRMMIAMACAAVVPAGAQTPPATTVAVADFDAAQARAAMLNLADELEANFVHPDVAKRYAAMLRANVASGAYDRMPSRVAFADRVTADLMAVAPDGHLGLMANPPPPPTREAAAPAQAMAPVAAVEQPGLIAPGIAYIRFNGFPGDAETVRQVTAFMDANAGARTLIVDQRSSRGGGLAEMDVMLPRLFARPATVMVMDMRASVAERNGGLPFPSLVPVASPKEFVRAEHRITPVSPASPWARTKVYVLTAGRTASAAEHFASVMKESGRATLIGETTAGAGNFGGVMGLPGGYASFVPFGHSYYPGKTGWEGVGVTPSIATPPERALYEALVREGLAPAEAERLSESHTPTQPMTRRRPLRS